MFSKIEEITKEISEFLDKKRLISNELDSRYNIIETLSNKAVAENINSMKLSENTWHLKYYDDQRFSLEMSSTETIKDILLKKIFSLFDNSILQCEKVYISDTIYFSLYSPINIHFINVEEILPFVKTHKIAITSFEEFETFLREFKTTKDKYLEMEKAYKAFKLDEFEIKKSML